jgi:methionine salvage enolase-phosphatase E1
VDAQSIVFLSDNLLELKAASKAGMRVVLLRREGNAPVENEKFKEAETFDGILDLFKKK